MQKTLKKQDWASYWQAIEYAKLNAGVVQSSKTSINPSSKRFVFDKEDPYNELWIT
ncbi:hypothetical protein [Bacillus sp. UNCCL81]|uniref:hypothetical protein n=1 Tax=Bacillus sp. UNCCL81 TaxID=1502755 RepID=UPI0004068D8E|nr:hypothetical protein [Bacillus sp. UNCCL81]